MWNTVAISMLSLAFSPNLDRDETVVFFPTHGRLVEDQWQLGIHGWVFEPEQNSLSRAATVALFRTALGIERGEASNKIFDARIRLFLVDNERGQRFAVRFARRDWELAESQPNGHFSGTYTLSREEAKVALFAAQSGTGAFRADQGWLPYELVTPKRDKRQFAGAVQLIEPEGVSVISDIDDTIKVTQVTDKHELLKNTFLREFQAVDGMAEIYTRWRDEGATFHYVSSSPWQLYEPLEAFRQLANFPSGTFHLKTFRAKDFSALELLDKSSNHKPRAIDDLLTAFPRRRFILVGDSAERDPEIYGDVARKYPQQIATICIREVGDATANAERYRQAFRDVDARRWMIFQQADELESVQVTSPNNLPDRK